MSYFHPTRDVARLLSTLALLLATGACDPDSKKVGDEPTMTEGSTSETSTSETSDSDDTTTTDPTSGGESICEPFEGSTCVSPSSECQNPNANCGGQNSLFTAEGCPRPSCSDDNDCPDGERCEQGFPSTTICSEQDGDCACEGTLDGNGSVCVPEELIPEFFCGQFNDEAGCLNAELTPDNFRRCLWATPSLLKTSCGEPEPLPGRCLAAEYHGEGCSIYCENDALLSWRETEDGIEVFADPLCEYTTLGWEDWSPPPGYNAEEIACMCAAPAP